MRKEILDFLKMNDVEYKERQSLADFSPIKIGGKADIITFPNSIDKLALTISFLENNKIKYKIVGRMSNLLFSDDDYSGVVVRTDQVCHYCIDGLSLSVCCGASLPYISGVLCRSGLSGFEALSGIPGSIGGAIVGNAGAFGSDISSMIDYVTFFDLSCHKIITLDKKELNFSYRSSVFKNMRAVILSACFTLAESDFFKVKCEMDRCREIRMKSQPVAIPSLGSTFKRPGEKIFAARLIDDCGLKGVRIGDAKISEKHAGFIVNVGSATAQNYRDLSDYARKCVFEKFGILLENEVEFVY